MKVLISAYSCRPNFGSEGGVGWNVIRELSEKHELTVITREKNRQEILGESEAWLNKVTWEFVDPPGWLTFWKKGSRGLQLFYIIWQYTMLRHARALFKSNQFDVTHHLTFGKYWIPSPLALENIPFVFGPVGGGDSTPSGLRGQYGFKGKLSEWVRDHIRYSLNYLPFVRQFYRRAGYTLAATEQTERELRDLGVARMRVQLQSGLHAEDLIELGTYGTRAACGQDEPLELVTACRLIHWKAVNLAIESVAVAKARGLKVNLTVLQDGPERDRLELLATKRGVDERVTFLGRLPELRDVYKKVAESDALIHPALHEAFGQSVLESLALGTPVICLKWGGPGVIVDDETGIRVQPGSFDQTVEQLADGIEKMIENKESFSPEACRKRAAAFTWRSVSSAIEDAYLKAIEDRSIK